MVEFLVTITKTGAYQADSRCPIDCEHNLLNNDQLVCHMVLTEGNSSEIDIQSRNSPHCTLYT